MYQTNVTKIFSELDFRNMETRSMAKRRKIAETVSFEDLPDEIILQIFTHLEFYDNALASQVSKRWKWLSEDQFLWRKVKLDGKQVPAKFIEKVLRHGCQYLGLRGTEITNVSGPNLFSVSNQLKYLSISCDNYFASHHEVLMENLLGATKSLEKLSIRCDREYDFHFQPTNIIQNNQTLTVLRISSMKSLNFETVQLIFTNCLQLTEVSLVDCSMSVEALSFLCNNLTSKLKKLSLFCICAFDSEDYILGDEHVIAITNCCPQLEELDLGGQENVVSEVALSTIIEKLPNLVMLKLPNTAQIEFPNLLRVRSMPNLKHLRVHVVEKGYNPRDALLEFVASGASLDLMLDMFDKLERETPFMKALVKNLPNLKINEGQFDIAHPDPCILSNQRLWEIECKSTHDFYEP